MHAFPLIRTKLSNEWIMTALLAVLLLYRLPAFAQAAAALWDTAILLAFALAVDASAGFIRHKRPVCAVSGAVTAVLLQLLTPGVPLWGELIGVAFALIAGKHIWGGTGRNPVNPAISGMLLLSVLFSIPVPPLAATLLLIPAMVLSLPFLLFRPFASLGMIAGMTVALALRPEALLPAFAAYGVALWGCIVITDPVTTTPRPLAGAAVGLAAGFLPVTFGGSPIAMAAGLLAANLLSLAADRMNLESVIHFRSKIRTVVPFSESIAFHDLVGVESDTSITPPATADEILKRIEEANVFGLGGAAFPTARKIKTVIASDAAEKHLIVNAVECDPGLIHDKWLLANRNEDIADGIDILRHCVPFASVTVAVKHGSPPAFQQGISVRRVPDVYPAGAEKLLIREVLNVRLADGVIPAEAGILVLNVQTVIAVYEAARGSIARTRYLTVANLRTNTGVVARVRLGANAQDTLQKIYPGSAPVFVGGGMMQAKLARDDTTVDQTVNFIATDRIPRYRESPHCSRCGLCAAVCPAELSVSDIVSFVRLGLTEKAAALHPERCISCGACSRVCLAGRNLSETVQEVKQRNQLIDCRKEAYNSID